MAADRSPRHHLKISGSSERDEDSLSLKRHQCYLDACKYFNTTPVTYVIKQLSNQHLVVRKHSIGAQGARALAVALLENNDVKTLDVEDNGVGAEGARAIAEMLGENRHITSLNISENQIGTEGTRALKDLFLLNKWITSLNIAGSNLVDKDAYLIAEVIEKNRALQELIASHNAFEEEGGFILAHSLAKNETLRILDLSWNHLRGKGSMSIAACLQSNVGIKKLNIAWNGFSKDDCCTLGKVLKANTTLEELDLSHNRLTQEALGHLMKGVQDNESLVVLKIGGNAISAEVAMVILQAIDKSETTNLSQLDLGRTEVEEDFRTLLDDMQTKRPLLVNCGPVIRRYETNALATEVDANMEPEYILFRHMYDNHYRVIDLLKWLDKDGSMSICRKEFKQGMLQATEFPFTELQLDTLLDRLDIDDDGEVNLAELLAGERDFRRRLRRQHDRLSTSINKKQKLQETVLSAMRGN